jgi:hypothetical protein
MTTKATSIFFTIVLVIGTSVSVSAGPRLEVINPTINFGRVTQNKVVTSDSWIRSVGDEPIKIVTLFSGCGCTEIPLPDSTIKPGDSLRLPIRFSTDNSMGRVSKRPTIRTNAGKEVIALSILAEVLVDPSQAWPVVLTPDVADVSQYGEKTRRLDRFWLKNQSNENLRVYVVDTALKSFEVKVPGELKAFETIEGKLRVVDKRITDDFEESVTFRIEGKETYFYTLPVYRRYRPNASASR